MEEKPKVIILGGGASSVFAYYGALAAGYSKQEVQIWAHDELTYPPGAFWLHQLPPNAGPVVAPSQIDIKLRGTAAMYSYKQWAEDYPNSAERLAGKTIEAYNPHIALPKLWAECNVKKMQVRWDLGSVASLASVYRIVIVTFPIQTRVINELKKYKVPVFHQKLSPEDQGDNLCLYNGDSNFLWVRLTSAFGFQSVEYPHFYITRLKEIEALEQESSERYGQTVPKLSLVPEIHPTVKPVNPRIGTNILLTGRWATLNRRALSHHSFEDVRSFLTGGSDD